MERARLWEVRLGDSRRLQSEAWPGSSFYLQKGPNGKAVSGGQEWIFRPCGICPQNARLLCHPAPTFQRKGFGGGGAAKHLAQVQESWSRLAELTGGVSHQAPNVLQSSWAHIDSGFCPVVCLKPWAPRKVSTLQLAFKPHFMGESVRGTVGMRRARLWVWTLKKYIDRSRLSAIVGQFLFPCEGCVLEISPQSQ